MKAATIVIIGNEIKKIYEELNDFNCIFIDDENEYNNIEIHNDTILTIVLSYLNSEDRQNRLIEIVKSIDKKSNLTITMVVTPKNDFTKHFTPDIAALKELINPIMPISKSTLNEYEADMGKDGIYYLSDVIRGTADIIDYQKKGDGIDIGTVKEAFKNKGLIYAGFYTGDNRTILENVLIKSLDNNGLKENLSICGDVIVSIACPVNLGFRASKSLELVYKFFDESVNILFDVRPSDKENDIKVTILGVVR